MQHVPLVLQIARVNEFFEIVIAIANIDRYLPTYLIARSAHREK